MVDIEDDMPQIAKIFTNGRSQAVRLPASFRPRSGSREPRFTYAGTKQPAM